MLPRLVPALGWAPLVVLSVFGAPLQQKQAPPSPPPEEPRWEAANAVTVEGYIAEIREVNLPNRLPGIHLRLRTDNGSVDVYLGPFDYVMEFRTVLEKGSRVEIQGAKAKLGPAEIILARELHKGGTTLLLRDKNGQPYWNSKGRRVS